MLTLWMFVCVTITIIITIIIIIIIIIIISSSSIGSIDPMHAWWRFADQFHHHASLPITICTLLSPSMLVFFSISILWEHICILNARLGGETDQQNVIMHKAYCRHLCIGSIVGSNIFHVITISIDYFSVFWKRKLF